ncbi:hypothetical protein Tco_0852399 [Tanacetum coccineum]
MKTIHGYDGEGEERSDFFSTSHGVNGLSQSKCTHDSFNDIVDAIVKNERSIRFVIEEIEEFPGVELSV